MRILPVLKPSPLFFKRVFVLALPIASQNLLFSSLNMLDIFMIGQLGTDPVSSVSLANQVSFIVFLFIFGIGTGSSVFWAQFWGAGNKKDMHAVMGIALTAGLTMSLFVSLLVFMFPGDIFSFLSPDNNVRKLGADYLKWMWPTYPFTAVSLIYAIALRSTGNARLPFLISSLSLLINTVGNYILIFGKIGFPAMGVEGAAIATLIARATEAFLTVFFVYARKTAFAAPLKNLFSASTHLIKDYIKKVWPVVTNELGWSLGMSAYQVIFARVSTDMVAANTLAGTLINFAVVFFVGSSNACGVMIGNALGAHRTKRAKSYAKAFAVWAFLLGVFFGLLLILASDIFSRLFNISTNARYLLRVYIILFGCFMGFKIFNWHTVVGIFRSGGDTSFCMLMELGSVWLIGVPLVFLSALIWDLSFFWIIFLMQTEELVKFFIGLWRFVSGKWIKMVGGKIITEPYEPHEQMLEP
ncbi:MATE family efflux transporter [Spirochaetia bacterium 38H-sp]|uniref:Multidrug-efflux transporter n=1 Tax=Rarispira pelagica TaxID=3141764 RepID=A0ABU9U9C5_9SPIR